MPTEDEVRVMRLLGSIEIDNNAGKVIEGWGNDAVTVLCEAALGTYPGVRLKLRTNAVALLGNMSHPQAKETIHLLVSDPNPDVSIRAMRAAGMQRNTMVVGDLGRLLSKSDLSVVVAAEVVKALTEIGTPEARSALDTYAAVSSDEYAHRRSPLVLKYLEKAGY